MAEARPARNRAAGKPCCRPTTFETEQVADDELRALRDVACALQCRDAAVEQCLAHVGAVTVAACLAPDACRRLRQPVVVMHQAATWQPLLWVAAHGHVRAALSSVEGAKCIVSQCCRDLSSTGFTLCAA